MTASTPSRALGRMGAGGESMGAQVQFDGRVLLPAVIASTALLAVEVALGGDLVPALFMGLGAFVFLAFLTMVFAYPAAWYMKLRAVDGLPRWIAVLALVWRLALATALMTLLTSLILAAKFLNSFLPEWSQVALTLVFGALMWYSIIQDLRAARRQRRSPVVDLSKSRSVTLK